MRGVLGTGRGVGIDLDNTIIDYTSAFAYGVAHLGLDGTAVQGGKTALRDGLRRRPDGEQRWRELQAFVYGPGIVHAQPFSGVEGFFATAAAAGIGVTIVSHKTRAAAADAAIDLRAYAREWLRTQRFADGVALYFADTREEKLEIIARVAPAVFVDDLLEVLADPAFPPGVGRWLFAPDGGDTAAATLVDRVVTRWDDLREALLDA